MKLLLLFFEDEDLNLSAKMRNPHRKYCKESEASRKACEIYARTYSPIIGSFKGVSCTATTNRRHTCVQLGETRMSLAAFKLKTVTRTCVHHLTTMKMQRFRKKKTIPELFQFNEDNIIKEKCRAELA